MLDAVDRGIVGERILLVQNGAVQNELKNCSERGKKQNSTKLCGTDYVPGALRTISFPRFTAAGQVQSVTAMSSSKFGTVSLVFS